MKSYVYKAGDIVNGWKILEKLDKYVERSGQKFYAYRVKCIHCGEEDDKYGIGETIQKCKCRKANRAIKILKEQYVGKIYDGCKIINFFYHKNKGIVGVFKNIITNKVSRRIYTSCTVGEVQDKLNKHHFTKQDCCEKFLAESDFIIDNKRYITIDDLVKDFYITKYRVMNYLCDKDLEGLWLYAKYTKHTKLKKKK